MMRPSILTYAYDTNNNTTEIKRNKFFNTFTDLTSLELEVPAFFLVTGCVSARREKR
jgi:hypothetical protein